MVDAPVRVCEGRVIASMLLILRNLTEGAITDQCPRQFITNRMGYYTHVIARMRTGFQEIVWDKFFQATISSHLRMWQLQKKVMFSSGYEPFIGTNGQRQRTVQHIGISSQP